MRMMSRSLTALGVTAGLLMAVAAPASAHNLSLFHGQDYGQIVEHHTARVWDEECDGNGVFVQYQYTTIGGVATGEVHDPDGCFNDGGERGTYPQRMTRARICEVNVGCAPWTTVW